MKHLRSRDEIVDSSLVPAHARAGQSLSLRLRARFNPGLGKGASRRVLSLMSPFPGDWGPLMPTKANAFSTPPIIYGVAFLKFRVKQRAGAWLASVQVISMFDFQRLRKLRESRGLNKTEISREVGLNVANYRKIEHGFTTPKLETSIALAACFDIPLDALVPQLGPYWQHGGWGDTRSVDRFVEEMRHANDVLTIHPAVDGYLLDPEMAVANSRKFTIPKGYSQEQVDAIFSWANRYWEAQRAVRIQSDFTHRIIGPLGFFEDEVRPEWIEKTKQLLGEQDLSAVALLEPRTFLDMRSAVSRFVPGPDWKKITILDDEVAMIRVGKSYLTTYHLDTVRQLKANVELIVERVVPHTFPSRMPTPTDVENCNFYTLAKLRRLETAAYDRLS